MEQSVITGALAISVALLNPSSINNINTTSHQAPIQEMRDYRVEEGDSIISIAKNIYGSEEFWTTIWNDNSWIKNPDIIEKGWIIKIRNIKPVKPSTFDQEIVNTENTPIPTVTPTMSSSPEQIATTPTPQSVVQTSSNGPLNEAQITFLGNCEAGMNPTRNSGNGYYGAFQFSYGTWKSMGTAYERADLAPLEVQIDAVQRLVARSSIFHQFPGCARRMQAEGLL